MTVIPMIAMILPPENINANIGTRNRIVKANATMSNIRPRYGKKALRIEPIMRTGFRAEIESNIMTASRPIGNNKTPNPSRAQKMASVL